MAKWIHTFYTKRNQIFDSRETIAQLRKTQAESNGMSVCDHAKAEVEVLLGSDDTIEKAKHSLCTLETHIPLEIKLLERKTPYLESYFFKTFPHQDLIREIINTHTKHQIRLSERSSVSDDNILATLGIPVISWGPDGGNAHQSHEYVDLKRLKILSNMYQEFLSHLSS